MTNLLKRLLSVLIVAATAMCLAACTSSAGGSGTSSAASGDESATSSASAEAQLSAKHVIGVAVYNVSDSEVMMFKGYLLDYVAKECFDDIQFVYSGSITSEEDLLTFIDDIAALGGEGIMAFTSIDLPAEVKRCADHGMYHMMASGTVSKEDFAAVEDDEHFLGAIGPMIEMEYNAGSNMVRNYIENKVGNRYFIMSGGAAVGNEMHYQRTLGMLDALETGYGVDLGQTKELAKVDKAETIEVDDLTVTIAPGYVAREGMRPQVENAFNAGSYDVVLSSLPVSPIQTTLDTQDVKIAQVDCYSQDNQLRFSAGKLDYLAGKYGSIVGPSVVAMYNAITGHAADFRDNGKAFQIVQNFWSSSSREDFEMKYEFASNTTSPAYNFKDLYSICKERNPSATFDDFKELASKASYEDALARRAAD